MKLIDVAFSICALVLVVLFLNWLSGDVIYKATEVVFNDAKTQIAEWAKPRPLPYFTPKKRNPSDEYGVNERSMYLAPDSCWKVISDYTGHNVYIGSTLGSWGGETYVLEKRKGCK